MKKYIFLAIVSFVASFAMAQVNIGKKLPIPENLTISSSAKLMMNKAPMKTAPAGTGHYYKTKGYAYNQSTKNHDILTNWVTRIDTVNNLIYDVLPGEFLKNALDRFKDGVYLNYTVSGNNIVVPAQRVAYTTNEDGTPKYYIYIGSATTSDGSITLKVGANKSITLPNNDQILYGAFTADEWDNTWTNYAGYYEHFGSITFTYPYGTGDFISNGVEYKILSSADQTASAVWHTADLETATKLTLPKLAYNEATETFYTVTSIGDGAFVDCKNLQTVNIKSALTSIGAGAFIRCSSLSSINIPAGVTAIKDETFKDCQSLSAVTLPDNLASLGKSSFSNSGLTSVSIPSMIISIPESCFANCSSLTTITNQTKFFNIGKESFAGCSSLKEIHLFSNAKVSDRAFYNCTSLSSVKVAYESGHDYVDLGLPSGTLWATTNVGADNPEDYGLYFAWGETTGYTSDTSDGRSFNWASYKWCNGSFNTQTKYCTSSSYGTVDNKTELEAEDDAATVNWGNDWQMPSYDQITELYNSNYTTTTWTTKNGVGGRLITSKSNGNSIFLPAAGYRDNFNLYNAGSRGGYWSRSLDSSYAYYLRFNSNYIDWNSNYRYYGHSVRPVRVQK